MAKYFLDTEFIVGWKKPIKCLPAIGFNKPYHSIQLISIGIVSAEDGRTYYAISNEFNPYDADEWVQKNVFAPMLKEYVESLQGVRQQLTKNVLNGKSLEKAIGLVKKWVGKSNKDIADEIFDFVSYYFPENYGKKLDQDIEFVGYFCDYDWVLLCSLYGNMSDLPKHFPKYCIDLKQKIDETISALLKKAGTNSISIEQQEKLQWFQLELYGTQTNEHHALEDARWNKRVYDNLGKLKESMPAH